MSIKFKFLLITSVLLIGSSATIFLINRESFLDDKRSYLYASALERVDSAAENFQRSFDVNFDRISSALQLFDPATQQFPPQIKKIAENQTWGDIGLYTAEPGFPLRLVDAIGQPSNLPESQAARLSNIAEGQTQIDVDLATPDRIRIFFRQGNYRIFGNLKMAFFKALRDQGEMGLLKVSNSEFYFPPHLKELQPLAPQLMTLMTGDNNGVKDITYNSRPYLVSYRTLPIINTVIFEIHDKKKIFSVLDSTMNRTLFASAIILLAGLLAIYFSVDNLTGNLSKLAGAMQSFATSGTAKKLQINSQDEVGKMSGVFNSMQEKIENLLKQTQEKARMASELETAKEVQSALLPKAKVDNERYTVKGYYQPASECGGDLWFHNCKDDKVFVFIGDATGHGVPAALITAAARSILSMCVDENIWSPSKVLSMINKVLCDIAGGEKMMTAFAAVIDLSAKKLTYSNASHDVPFIVPLSEEGRKFKKNDLMFLGEANNKRLGHEKGTSYQEESLPFNPGQTFFAYTDGLIDAKNSGDEIFGERIVLKLAADSATRGSQRSLYDQIARKASEFTEGVEQPDDITFVSFHWRLD
ncbi:MAG: SpoIIE family protein phosphatase [Bdellovibrio sp.]